MYFAKYDRPPQDKDAPPNRQIYPYKGNAESVLACLLTREMSLSKVWPTSLIASEYFAGVHFSFRYFVPSSLRFVFASFYSDCETDDYFNKEYIFRLLLNSAPSF